MRTLIKSRSLTRSVLLLAALFMIMPAISFADVAVSITVAPPAIPVYTQPVCPHEGYLWTPGYWAYGPAGYYWVPGVWLAPPQVGVLWTPGYWGFAGGVYVFHRGYWGPHVGFYGGINYGFGYGGVGFFGGRWNGGVFAYNTAVVNVDRTVVRNVYEDRTVIHNTTINHYSWNGPGGVTARPTADERTAMHEQHVQPTSEQFSHEHAASQDRNQWQSNNHGQPKTVAMDSVNGRRFDQQGRIANGVRSGQLTPHETAHLENGESKINHEVATDRKDNGGHLTAQEHKQVNHQQNQESKQIYADKHNDKKDAR
jgi:hypothetical protein